MPQKRAPEEELVLRAVNIPITTDKKLDEIRRSMGLKRSEFLRYIATRFAEQYICFSKQKQINLQPWEEVVGTLKSIQNNKFTTTVVLVCTQNLEISLSYQEGTIEANILQNLRQQQGQKIGILKTDQHLTPLIIKRYKEMPLAKPQALPKNSYRNHGFVKRWISFKFTSISLKSWCF